MPTLRAVLLVVLASGCAAAQRSGSQCSSRAAQRCLTLVVCDMDRVLGCEVCRCSDAPYVPPAGAR